MSAFELAQLNIAIMKEPIDSPLLADFVASLDRINAIAGEGVSPEDLATCLSVLQRMSENLTREAARLSAQ